MIKKSSKLPIRCERLKELRTKNGYTQSAIAERISVTTKTYRTWEIGVYNSRSNSQSYPPIDNEKLEKLSDIYNVSIDYILGKSNYTSVDNEEIGKITGLNNFAIATLKSLKKTYDYDHTMDILNFIMTDTYLFGSFLGYLRDYIEPNFTIPVHPERDKDTGNISYVENLDVESSSIFINKERSIYLGRKNGEFNGKPLYDIQGIPIENLSRMNLLLVEEIFKTWKDKYNARR